MSRRRLPAPAKLVVSVIFRDEERFDEVLPLLEERFGPVEERSPGFPFDRTDYYEREMGAGLTRRFVVMRDAVPRDSLAAVKIAAEDLENRLSRGGSRTVNIDPGLLTEENVTLATGKNYSHRVYLGEGVFADLALVYRAGEYRPLPWTYPDLASDGIRAFLAGVRRRCRDGKARSGGETLCG